MAILHPHRILAVTSTWHRLRVARFAAPRSPPGRAIITATVVFRSGECECGFSGKGGADQCQRHGRSSSDCGEATEMTLRNVTPIDATQFAPPTAMSVKRL